MFKQSAILSIIWAGSSFLVTATQAQSVALRAPSEVPAHMALSVNVGASDSELLAAMLAGRFAQNTDNPDLAAKAWARAYVRRPDDGALLARAVSANLKAGDLATAVALSKMAAPDLLSDYAALTLAVDAFAQGRFSEVMRRLEARTFQPSLGLFADHLRAYALLAQNEPEKAVRLVPSPTGNQRLARAAAMSRAMIMQQAGLELEAAAVFDATITATDPWPLGVRAFGDWLVTTNRAPFAIQHYKSLIRRGGSNTSFYAIELARVQNGALPQAPKDLRAVAASGLTTVAQGLALEGGGATFSVLLHLVHHLDPRSDEVGLVLANYLIDQGLGELAQPLLTKILPTSPDYVLARTELVWFVFQEDQARAVSLARETLQALPSDPMAQRLLADVLSANRDDHEAEMLYSDLIGRSEASGPFKPDNWPLYFGRGGARERQGNWAGALSDFRFANAAAPNHPSVLNYLGYAFADRGENIDEAIVMLRTAVRINPKSGAIMDSLGWAYFRAGRYEDAISTLETAASLSPDLVEISDHLGDAYWRSGRDIEARLEWMRTLRLNPSRLQAEAIAIKLRDGLPPDPNDAARQALATHSGPLVQR